MTKTKQKPTAKPRTAPGRPRTYPEGTSNTDRKALSLRRLKAGGGHCLTLELGPLAWQALQQLAPRGKRGPYIERLIVQTAAKSSD